MLFYVADPDLHHDPAFPRLLFVQEFYCFIIMLPYKQNIHMKFKDAQAREPQEATKACE